MSRLASLASRRPWRVIIIAVLFLGVSVVVGAPLTGNLTAGGFEDKDAQFFQAREQLEDATGASPGPALIALVDPGTDVTAGAGPRRGRARGRHDRRGPRRPPGGHRLRRRRRRADLRRRHVLVRGRVLRAGRRRRRRGRRVPHRRRARERAERLPRGRRGRRRAGRLDHRRGPRAGRDARVPDHLPALAVGLPRLRGGAPAVADGRRGDLRLVPGDRAGQRGPDPLRLCPQPRDRPEPGPRDRLQPADHLALPRGDRRARPRPRGAGPHPPDGGAQRPLQRGHRGRRPGGADGLPAALPVLHGPRGRDGRPDRRGHRPPRPPRRARAARPPHQQRRARLPQAGQRARRRGGHVRLLVPPLQRRHAAPGRSSRPSRPRCW